MRPRPRTLLAAVMFAAPLLLVVAYGLVLVGEMVSEAHDATEILGLAILGGVCSVVPGGLLLLQYRAIRGKSPRAAGWVAGICLGLAALGVIGWVEGFLRLVGVFPRDREWGSWWELVTYSAFQGYLAFIGSEHWRWYRVLRAAKQTDPQAWDD